MNRQRIVRPRDLAPCGMVRVQERNYRGDTDEPKTERSKRVLALGALLDEYRRQPIRGYGASRAFTSGDDREVHDRGSQEQGEGSAEVAAAIVPNRSPEGRLGRIVRDSEGCRGGGRLGSD